MSKLNVITSVGFGDDTIMDTLFFRGVGDIAMNLMIWCVFVCGGLNMELLDDWGEGVVCVVGNFVFY